MNGRPAVGRGLFYTRDSQGRSDLASPGYVEWARGEAERLGVAFDGTPEAITAMIRGGISAQGDLYLDYGISGNHLSRPGLDAFRRKALGDPGVTHLFVPRRDRIARPHNPDDGWKIEAELRRAGLTLVLMGQVYPPIPRGQRAGIGDLVTGVIDYESSGKFRRDLAEKLIHAKIKLAERGLSIGGEPPYGFRRWLVGPDGARKRELEEGEIIKMAGHHVVWLPTVEAELRVVHRILALIETVPATRIARMLNEEGVPSPKAGRLRRVGGVAVPNSGLWGQNTVRGIASHPLLIAIWEYGKRGMGDQLRFTPHGPRDLTDDDFWPDGRLKAVKNPEGEMIRTMASFVPIIPEDRRASILRTLEDRGKHLKGKPRTRKDSPNPLGCRVFDLNCGWPMYRHARRGRWGYQCGLYQNSQAKSCTHNVVAGEAATRFILACLRQRVLAPTAMVKLEARLREMAAAEVGDGADRRQAEADRSKLAALERTLATVGRNMALSETPEERAVTAKEFGKLQVEAARLRSQIQGHRPPEAQRAPEREVEVAMAGLGRLEGLADSEEDQASVGELFRSLDVRLYLRFRSAERGRRQINEVGGGVVTFGATPPPSPLYDGPTDRAIIRQKLASGEPVTSVADHAVIRVGLSGPEVNWSANVQRGTSRCSGPRPRAALCVLSMLAGPWPGPLSLVVRRQTTALAVLSCCGTNWSSERGNAVSPSRN